MRKSVDFVYENNCRDENEDKELSRLHNYDDNDKNKDARFRNIKCPSVKKLNIDVGTYISKYNRYNSIEINHVVKWKTE